MELFIPVSNPWIAVDLIRKGSNYYIPTPCSCGCGQIAMVNKYSPRKGRIRGHKNLYNGRLFFVPSKNRWMVSTKNGGKVQWAQVIMEGVIGRPLKKNEVVHHIDENSLNDDPSNLLVCTRKEHAKIHGQLRGGINA